jgi:hypothetical protein
MQYLAKNQSTQRCQSLITQGSDHPPVLEPHMVLNYFQTDPDARSLQPKRWQPLTFKACCMFEGPIRLTREGGACMGADKNSSRRRWKLLQDEHGFQHMSLTHYPSWPSPRSHWSATGPRNQHIHPSDPRTQWNTKPRVFRPTPVKPVSTTGQTGPCW